MSNGAETYPPTADDTATTYNPWVAISGAQQAQCIAPNASNSYYKTAAHQFINLVIWLNDSDSDIDAMSSQWIDMLTAQRASLTAPYNRYSSSQ